MFTVIVKTHFTAHFQKYVLNLIGNSILNAVNAFRNSQNIKKKLAFADHLLSPTT